MLSANQTEEIAILEQRLELHRRTLAHYLNQQAQFSSAYAPPALTHGIKEAREGIRECKARLRGYGVPTEDHHDDEEPAATQISLNRHYLNYILLFLILITSIIASTFLENLDITFSIALLFGVWVIDAWLKSKLNISNETVLADLSFSALVFTGSLGIRQAVGLSNTNAASFVRLSAFSLLLLFFWVINLDICHNIHKISSFWPHSVQSEQVRREKFLKFLSISFGFISASFALLLKLARLI